MLGGKRSIVLMSMTEKERHTLPYPFGPLLPLAPSCLPSISPAYPLSSFPVSLLFFVLHRLSSFLYCTIYDSMLPTCLASL